MLSFPVEDVAEPVRYQVKVAVLYVRRQCCVWEVGGRASRGGAGRGEGGGAPSQKTRTGTEVKDGESGEEPKDEMDPGDHLPPLLVRGEHQRAARDGPRLPPHGALQPGSPARWYWRGLFEGVGTALVSSLRGGLCPGRTPGKVCQENTGRRARAHARARVCGGGGRGVSVGTSVRDPKLGKDMSLKRLRPPTV